MKGFRFLIILTLVRNEYCVTGTTVCCPLRQDGEDFIYESRTDYEYSDEGVTPAAEIVDSLTPEEPTPKNKTQLCESAVTNVYERNHDIDMKYVQDSITALWRIIFSLIFILILLVFLISYVSSLILKNNVKRCPPIANKTYVVADIPVDKTPPLYFPIINGSRTANFLKDLDPIYDYPCSLQSDYERV